MARLANKIRHPIYDNVYLCKEKVAKAVEMVESLEEYSDVGQLAHLLA